MNTEQLKKFCLSFPGASERLYQAPTNILTYSVDDRIFAYFKTSQPEQWRFSIRTSPDRFLELTDMPGIKSARFRGRFHWVTIVTVDSFPEDYLRELVTSSYRKALSLLSKTKQSAVIKP
ncbi:MmcQ/YjbR family DNA-binding protein [Glaciimonas soli]|uniref:DNA-binding protein (MmcQ/YjbR family) n=1 Tax=Glaciimonas soli TaxID=2590999 RepID=A0A843YUT3_9BURK|nr:MmcQ/YjbR family DNA-binding protein [Glaciimonas soli]MQR01464.1 hypothetical protein [Glaciimonas soli]